MFPPVSCHGEARGGNACNQPLGRREFPRSRHGGMDGLAHISCGKPLFT